MFNLLKSSVDRTLQNFNHQFQYQGRVFTVRRHEYAPVTLKVEGDGVFFEVDLVPSIEFDFRYNMIGINHATYPINLQDLFHVKWRVVSQELLTVTKFLITPEALWPYHFTELISKNLKLISITLKEAFCLIADV